VDWTEFLSYIRHLNKRDQKRVQEAFDLAAELHRDQKRKSGDPYFVHPVTIAMRLAFIGADADTLIAALLHDTVEDTPITLEEIKAQFNGDVTKLIDGVTKLSAADVAEKPTLNEQVETIRKIFSLMEQDVRIMVIKLFDRLHNMETIRFLSEARQKALAQETMDIFVKIADRLSMQDLRYELERLCLQVLEPHVYEQLEVLREKSLKHGQKLLQSMHKTLATHHAHFNDDITMQFQFKSWDRLRAQLAANGSAITGLSSITIIFNCKDRETCYRVLGMLHEHWKRESMSFQDYINAPVINGYQGLHTTIILEDGTRVRCKIRTTDMQEYARKGVTVYAFDPKKRAQLNELLPWTQKISPLAEGTKDRSDEFWQSLQNDILGELMIIYGPGDKSAQLPKGSTVLDGAFYLFEDGALRLASIKANGQTVPFSFILQHGMTLIPEFSEEEVAEGKWLQETRTSFATAKIRASLSKRGKKERIASGKELLQGVLQEKEKGYLEEYDEKTLEKKVSPLGYKNLHEIYIALGEGRLDPYEVYKQMFERLKNNEDEKPETVRLRFNTEIGNTQLLNKLGELGREGLHIDNIRYSSEKDGNLDTVSMVASLTPKEQRRLIQELSLVGAQHIETVTRSPLDWFYISMVIILWGINPVVARWFLESGVPTLTLVTLRLFAFSAFSILFYVGWRLFLRPQYSGGKNITIAAILPSLGLVGMSLFNYLSVGYVAPSLHLTVLRLNALLLPVLLIASRKQKNVLMSLLLFCLFLGGIILLWEETTSLPLEGIFFTVCALVSYTFYSLSSEHSLHGQKIGARYPVFLLNIGLFLGIAGCAILPLQEVNLLWGIFTLPVALYILICVFLPHVFHAILLRKTKFKHFTDAYLLEVPIAFAAEILLLNLTQSPLMYALIVTILGCLLLYRWKDLAVRA
jgi:GTP pyrophosphokinase